MNGSANGNSSCQASIHEPTFTLQDNKNFKNLQHHKIKADSDPDVKADCFLNIKIHSYTHIGFHFFCCF